MLVQHKSCFRVKTWKHTHVICILHKLESYFLPSSGIPNTTATFFVATCSNKVRRQKLINFHLECANCFAQVIHPSISSKRMSSQIRNHDRRDSPTLNFRFRNSSHAVLTSQPPPNIMFNLSHASTSASLANVSDYYDAGTNTTILLFFL